MSKRIINQNTPKSRIFIHLIQDGKNIKWSVDVQLRPIFKFQGFLSVTSNTSHVYVLIMEGEMRGKKIKSAQW
jgi:hypothetical protein